MNYQALPEVMVGSSTEVSERLHRAAVPRALAVTFSDDSQQLVFEGVFRQVTAFLPQLIRQRQTDTLERSSGPCSQTSPSRTLPSPRPG